MTTTSTSTTTQATSVGNSAPTHILESDDDSDAEDEDEDEDVEEEEEVDGYLIATTLLSYSNLPDGHTIKKNTAYKACCKCDWCPCVDLAAAQCLDCDHFFCDGCRFQQWVSDAEIEAMRAWDGGPVFGQLVGNGDDDYDDDDACSEDSDIGTEVEQADAEGEEEEEESLHETSTASMEEALKELTEAIRKVQMGRLMQETSETEEEEDDLNNLLWSLDLH
ncbi:MAG: hypothetical protein LQ346_002873 [Caloplaca aetnensis]|nr:MAG: hypothetical protein LQ346_002873 [Caloplaca aetnensis]